MNRHVQTPASDCGNESGWSAKWTSAQESYAARKSSGTRSVAEVGGSARLGRRFGPGAEAQLALALILVAAMARGGVPLPFYDGFNYPEGNLNAVATPVWVVGNGSTTFEIAVSNAAALVGPPGFPASTGRGVRRAPSGTARRSVLGFASVPAVAGNTVYVSFLLNVQTPPAGTELIGYLDNNNTSQGSPQCGIFVAPGPRVGIGKKSSTPGFLMPTNLAPGTHLVVARYTFQAGNDAVDLWVDPPASSYGLLEPPPPLGGTTGGSDPASLDYFQIVTSAGAGSVMYLDEFRIGTRWADVVPAGDGPPGGGGDGAALLDFDALGLTADGLVVSAGQGTPGGFVQILGAPDPFLPLPNWMLVNYGNFDGRGRITFTNPVCPALPQAYYRLRVGDTGTKLDPPSILVPPKGKMVSPGQPARMTVSARGPMLHYLWLFNGEPIPGATNAVFEVPAAGPSHAGEYRVMVANPGGFVTSGPAVLEVRDEPPRILAEPADQSTFEGGSAVFVVEATGTEPLSYQWYFEPVGPLVGQTNAVLTLRDVRAAQAGQYRVIVTNPFGMVQSRAAWLQVEATPSGLPPTNVMGWAAFAGVTGGSHGGNTNSVVVSDYASFRAAVRSSQPLHIYVSGTIQSTENYTYVYGPNKSIIGLGTNAAFVGNLRINATNIIVRNLHFSNPRSGYDTLTIDGGSGGTGKIVWVDHCTFYNAPDGALDITKGADYITVSWCKFHYAPAPPGRTTHEFVNLIGSSDSDNHPFRVTFHHNWYGEGCRERMPSVRFGRVHVFNNYYDCQYNNYCIRTRINAEVLVENNYFLNVQNPWERYVTTGTPGKLRAVGNILNNCTWSATWTRGVQLIPGDDELGPELNPPPYPYVLHEAAAVPFYVQTYAGAGKWPFGP